MIPKGILSWSHEVSVVAREALTEAIRRETKIVMPDEQIPPAKQPLALQAAQKSPLVAISGRLTSKLVEMGVRVHTIGADRVTSSFYYIGEGGGEDEVRVEGDLVAAVGAMLGDRADNAAIERVLDGRVDRLLRSLSKGRITELTVELAAALPRAAADGTGARDIDLDAFEKELAELVGSSEKYTSFAQDIASKIGDSLERKVDVPLYTDAKKVSQGPFELTVGEKKVALPTYDRWFMTGPFKEPAAPAKAASAPAPAPAPAASPKPAPVAEKPVEKAAAAPPPSANAGVIQATPIIAASKEAPSNPPAAMKSLAAPMTPPRPLSDRPPPRPASRPDQREVGGDAIAAKQAADKAAAEAKAAEEKAAAEKAAAEAKAAEEKAAAEKAAAEAKAAEEKAAAERAEREKAERAERERAEEAAKAKVEKPAEAVPADDRRNATTQKIKRPEQKGIPWLWLLLFAAGAVVVWQVFFRHK